MIDKDKVNHIADLAKLNVSDEEMTKYQKQLFDILTEIDKINGLDIEGDIMISPTFNEDCYDDDIIEAHINKNVAFKNAKKVIEDYIAVPKVLEGEE